MRTIVLLLIRVSDGCAAAAAAAAAMKHHHQVFGLCVRIYICGECSFSARKVRRIDLQRFATFDVIVILGCI